MKEFVLVVLAALTFACSQFSEKAYGPHSFIQAHSYTGGFTDMEYRLRFEPTGHVAFTGRLGGLPCKEEWDVEPERFQAIAKVIDSDNFFAMDADLKDRPKTTHSNSVELNVVLDEKEKTVRGIRVDEPSDANRKFFAIVEHFETITDATRRIRDCFSRDRIKAAK